MNGLFELCDEARKKNIKKTGRKKRKREGKRKYVKSVTQNWLLKDGTEYYETYARCRTKHKTGNKRNINEKKPKNYKINARK